MSNSRYPQALLVGITLQVLRSKKVCLRPPISIFQDQKWMKCCPTIPLIPPLGCECRHGWLEGIPSSRTASQTSDLGERNSWWLAKRPRVTGLFDAWYSRMNINWMPSQGLRVSVEVKWRTQNGWKWISNFHGASVFHFWSMNLWSMSFTWKKCCTVQITRPVSRQILTLRPNEAGLLLETCWHGTVPPFHQVPVRSLGSLGSRVDQS